MFAKATEAYPAIDAALDTVLSTCAVVDPDRVTLTGVSLGGFGSFRYGALRAHRFAGIAPMSGFGALADAALLATLPLWVFHGDVDAAIPIAYARAMVEAIRKEGGHVRVTEFPGVGHDGPELDAVFSDPEVIAWLFSQRRAPR